MKATLSLKVVLLILFFYTNASLTVSVICIIKMYDALISIFHMVQSKKKQKKKQNLDSLKTVYVTSLHCIKKKCIYEFFAFKMYRVTNAS